MSEFWDDNEHIAEVDTTFWSASENYNLHHADETREWPRERIEREYTLDTLLDESQDETNVQEPVEQECVGSEANEDSHSRVEDEDDTLSKKTKDKQPSSSSHTISGDDGVDKSGLKSRKRSHGSTGPSDSSSQAPCKKKKPAGNGFPYIQETIPWRYRQHPCPSELCSRDRGHPGSCVVDMRYKLDIDLTGKQIHTYIYNEKQKHASNVELFWRVANRKLDKSQKQVEGLVSPLDGVYNRRQLGHLVTSDSTKLRKQINSLREELDELERQLDDLDYSVGEEIDKLHDKVQALKVHFNMETMRIQEKYQQAAKGAEREVEEKVKEYENFMVKACRALVCPFWVLNGRQAEPTNKQWLVKKEYFRKRKYRYHHTRTVMEYIHGSMEGAHYGAWFFLKHSASEKFWEEMLTEHKGGRFLKRQLELIAHKNQSSEEIMRKAIAQIFVGHLSRRKYIFMSRINDSYYNPDKDKWVRRKANLNGIDVKMARSIPYKHVARFIRTLDMGPVMQIPNHMGVCRTVTSLVIMIIDLNIKVKHLHENLVWFNDRPYHFIMQFSDDGAPETKELTMSIGTLTCWNLGQKVRSRELQYFLHGLSVPEKAAIMADLWASHTAEMAKMEGSVYTICGKRCTFSFEPSADMSWQSWAANEVGQSSSYFSPYGNVSIRNKATINGSLGHEDHNTWHPWSMAERTDNVKKLENYESSLSKDLSEEELLVKRRGFLLKNKMRQVGMPRIGKFVDQLRPEPLHTEINGWQYLLNIVYREGRRRHMMNKLLSVIAAPPAKTKHATTTTKYRGSRQWGQHNSAESLDQPQEQETEEAFWEEDINEQEDDDEDLRGAGIPALAKQIVEAIKDDARRLYFRLIGPQAIALARNWHKICDALKPPYESPRDQLLRLAIYKMGLCLREAASIFQQIKCDEVGIVRVKTLLQIYFNLHVLFFGPQYVSVTTWSLGYALPYHMKKLYDAYKVGYGITSMQSREAENAGIKLDLARTNRSRSTSGDNGKWWQVFRWNYVRTFYLPEHEPVPSNYKPNSVSRLPSFKSISACKNCGQKVSLDETCPQCDSDEMSLITQSAIRGELVPRVAQILNNTQSTEDTDLANKDLSDLDPAMWDESEDRPESNLDPQSIMNRLEKQEEAFKDFDGSDVEQEEDLQQDSQHEFDDDENYENQDIFNTDYDLSENTNTGWKTDKNEFLVLHPMDSDLVQDQIFDLAGREQANTNFDVRTVNKSEVKFVSTSQHTKLSNNYVHSNIESFDDAQASTSSKNSTSVNYIETSRGKTNTEGRSNESEEDLYSGIFAESSTMDNASIMS